jgi:hypothetical protein
MFIYKLNQSYDQSINLDLVSSIEISGEGKFITFKFINSSCTTWLYDTVEDRNKGYEHILQITQAREVNEITKPTTKWTKN